MRIAFISTMLHVPWGGADKLWTQTAATALGEGHAVLVAVAPGVAEHPRVVALGAAGAVIHQRDGFTTWNGRRAQWRQAWQHWTRSRHSLLAALDAFAPDFVLLNQGGAFDFTIEHGLLDWLRRKHPRFALICHSNSETDELSDEARAVAVSVVAEARWVAFVSTHNRLLAERQMRTTIPRAHVLQNPVEGRLDSPPAWPAESEWRLAVVARLEIAPKGLDILLDALALGLKDQPGWRLDFFGRGPDEAALRARAAARGLADRVNFCGFQSDIGQIWAGHHLLVLASRREGCPLAMLEALVHARPVLVVDFGGVSDWISDRANGFVCPTCDPAPLAEVFASAWAARGQWRAMGLEARRRALAQLDPFPERTLLSLVA